MGIVRVAVILSGNFPRWEFSEWELSGGIHPSGSFPNTSSLTVKQPSTGVLQVNSCRHVT